MKLAMMNMSYLYALRGTWMDRFKVGYHTGDAQALRNRYVSAYGPDQEVILWAMFESSAPLVIETLVHTALRQWHCGGELFLEDCLPTLVKHAEALCQSSVASHMAPLARTRERHSWSLEPTLRLPSKDLTLIKHWLVLGRDIRTAEFSAIIARSCEASDEEKWLSYRFEYMRAWGLQAVDEDFVDQNGTQCGSDKVTRLMQVLDAAVDLPAPCSAARMYRAQLAGSLRTGAVMEVIQALGFSGPFDLCHTVDNLSSGHVRERVLSTRCFQEWSDMRKLFSSRAKKKSEDWSAAEVREVVSVVLESVGLGLTTTKRTRQRNGAYLTITRHKRQRNGDLRTTSKRARQMTVTYQYILKPEAVIRMRELLALQRKDIEAAGRWSHLL